MSENLIEVKAAELKEFSKTDFDWDNIDLYQFDGLYKSIVSESIVDGVLDNEKFISLIPNEFLYKICKLQFIKIFAENNCYDFFGDNSCDMLIDGMQLENVIESFGVYYDLHEMHNSLCSLCDMLKGKI